MILKWIDYSGASHLIDGVSEAVGYGQRHYAEARAIAEFYDGTDASFTHRAGPDVYRTHPDHAEELGHDFAPDGVMGHTHPSVVSSQFTPAGDDERMRSTALLISDRTDSDGVTMVSCVARTFGVYVIIRFYDNRPRQHLLLDCHTAYLMSDNGTTVDRFTE